MSIRNVTLWFYFPSKEKMDQAIVGLLDLGMNVDSTKDLNAGLDESVPMMTRKLREKRMHEEMQAFEAGNIDAFMKDRKRCREPLPWQCIMVQKQETAPELMGSEYEELNAFVQQFDGEYDGQEHEIAESELEDYGEFFDIDFPEKDDSPKKDD